MKPRSLVRSIAVLLVGAPLLAQAQGDAVQRCMDVFAAQHFANRTTTFKVERDSAALAPLMLANTGTRVVQVVATERATGRVLATASCEVTRNGVGQVSISELIAQR